MIALDDRGLLRALVVFFIFLQPMFACALCSLQTPTVHIKTHFIKSQNHINGIDFEWVFSKNFTDLTILSYDLNDDKVLDEKELKAVKTALLDYLEQRAFLTSIKFYYDDNDSQRVFFNTKDIKVFIKDDSLRFSFSALFKESIEARAGLVFRVVVKDYDEYFNFGIVSLEDEVFNDTLYIKQNQNLNTSFYEFAKGKVVSHSLEQISLKEDKLNAFDRLNLNIFELLKSGFKNDNNFLSFCFLIFISVVYGFFHALGPGHGKLLTSSYFISSNKSYKKAFYFASLVGFIHIFSSFLLTSISLFVIENLVKTKVNYYALKINAGLIFALCLFMLQRKLRHKKTCFCKTCDKSFKISYLNYKPQKLKTIKSSSQISDFIIALGAGGIPCPATVLVFMLAYSLGKFYLAFICAFCISLGMSVVIFASAVFGSLGKKYLAFKGYLEYAGILMMMALSIWMMFFTNLRIV